MVWVAAWVWFSLTTEFVVEMVCLAAWVFFSLTTEFVANRFLVLAQENESEPRRPEGSVHPGGPTLPHGPMLPAQQVCLYYIIYVCSYMCIYVYVNIYIVFIYVCI